MFLFFIFKGNIKNIRLAKQPRLIQLSDPDFSGKIKAFPDSFWSGKLVDRRQEQFSISRMTRPTTAKSTSVKSETITSDGEEKNMLSGWIDIRLNLGEEISN